MNRSQLRDAARQLKQARLLEQLEEEQEITAGTQRKIEFIDESIDVKNKAVERRRQERNEWANLRRRAYETRREQRQTENAVTNQWYYQAGDLVVVKGRTREGAPATQVGYKPPAGTIAMVVETVDNTSFNGDKSIGSTITVMVDGQIENWNAKWVKHCE